MAAGESRRMGRLKPLLRFGDKTALAVIVEALNAAGVFSIHVVVGHKADKVIANAGVDVDFVINKNYKDGQFSSLQCGIGSLSRECRAVIVCLVDQPHVHPTWIRHLIETKSKKKAGIVRLRFGGKSGHPILFSSALFAEIVDMPSTATAKQLVKKHAHQTLFVEVESDGILYDADTPDDLNFIQRYMTNRTLEGFPPDA